MKNGLILLGGAAAVGGLLYATSVRQQIIRAARYVVPYEREHARNKLVTQGRAFFKGYSGCGDLWNYVLDVIGAPNDWVNRDSPRRGLKWKVAVNISQPFWRAYKAGARVKFYPDKNIWPKPGDMVLIGREPQELAHAFIILEELPPTAGGKKTEGKPVPNAVRHYRTAEYGGGNNRSGIGERWFDRRGVNIVGWPRHLVGWIDADKIPIDPKWAPGRVRSILHLTKPEREAA